MNSKLTNATRVLRRGALAAIIAAVGIVAGGSLTQPVAAQPSCEDDGCQFWLVVAYCADGYYNCDCNMVGSECRNYACDPEMPDECPDQPIVPDGPVRR